MLPVRILYDWDDVGISLREPLHQVNQIDAVEFIQHLIQRTIRTASTREYREQGCDDVAAPAALDVRTRTLRRHDTLIGVLYFDVIRYDAASLNVRLDLVVACPAQ